MRVTETTVYQFEELSDAAKEKARQWYREGEAEDFSDDEFILEPAKTAARLIGIEFAERSYQTSRGKTHTEADITWSLAYCQGDGLAFAGTYRFTRGAADAVRAEFPTDIALHAIADGLQALQAHYKLSGAGPGNMEGRASQDQRGHFIMDATVTDSETGEEPEDYEITKRFLELMRDFADWIYEGLKAEYESRQENEYVDDNIIANEYEFDEDGNRI
ncbi:MAG: hypothetical protein KGI06_06110 [Candidatus Micrarchaeota archaeon]|nr:hypothetical protein [Candidatus Micrarchaeota archaeon]